MDFINLATNKFDASLNQFWKTISIWLDNPHLLNKRVSSSKTIVQVMFKGTYESAIANIFENRHLLKTVEQNSVQFLSVIKLGEFEIFTENDPFDINKEGLYLIVKKLFPRDNVNFSTTLDASIIDKSHKIITCFQVPLCNDKRSLGLDWPYRLTCNNEAINLSVVNAESSGTSSVEWLKNKVVPCLIKWMKVNQDQKNSLVQGSLKLIPAERYCNLYQDLKKKYGPELVNKWPECTDPQKFVFEDIAIATYLLVLWEEERKEKQSDRKQSFVDLGCGNGLLVYILSSEGHKGLGIDLRKRKIWDLFSNTTRLEERTIIPSSSSLFPETDWLIGNHSDELTPWIPVIAARSSYYCRFFLLPCCAHEFDGRKFQRGCASNSQYSEYLNYVNTISEGCGFITKLDKLRIPSTKRIALIGWARRYLQTETNIQDKRIDEIINARAINSKASVPHVSGVEQDWSHDFKPRDIVEKVRNCTQIDKNIINEIIDLVASHLLRKVRIINVNGNQKTWNAGGKIELNEIAQVVPPTTLKQLKKECGGLQTLLRNNSRIFHVIKGAVQFRIPGSEVISMKKSRKPTNVHFQVKPCWFNENHPDGCPLSSEECTFKH